MDAYLTCRIAGVAGPLKLHHLDLIYGYLWVRHQRLQPACVQA